MAAQIGDSGRNGRIRISGKAGIRPDISVYRQASCWWSAPIAPRNESHEGSWIAGNEGPYWIAMPLATATIRPPRT